LDSALTSAIVIARLAAFVCRFRHPTARPTFLNFGEFGMGRESSGNEGDAGRLATWLAIAAAFVFFGTNEPAAYADDVVVEISGTLGTFGYGNQPAPLNGGSFSGTVTFSALPTAGNQVISNTADVNFYDAMHDLVFKVTTGYDTFSAGPSGYTVLTVGGTTSVGGTSVEVAGLSLDFTNNWAFGSNSGMVVSYGAGSPPDYNSGLSYTYDTGGPGTTFNNPVLMGQGTVPEPSSLALSLAGMIGAFLYARRHRRATAA
jgi:PEP-CTERM motif